MEIDEEAYALLRQQIEAEVAHTAELKRQNDLAEQAIKQALADAQSRELADRNREVSDRNRVKVNLDTNERVVGLADSLPQVFLAIHGIMEWCKEASRRFDRIDEIALIQLSGRSSDHRGRVAELKQELDQEHNERLLAQEYENLQELEGQAAQHGAIDVPLKLLNQVKRTREKIADLQGKLESNG